MSHIAPKLSFTDFESCEICYDMCFVFIIIYREVDRNAFSRVSVQDNTSIILFLFFRLNAVEFIGRNCKKKKLKIHV